MTETGGATTHRPGHVKLRPVGRSWPNYGWPSEDAQTTVSPEGEIIMKGPDAMLRYHNKPEETTCSPGGSNSSRRQSCSGADSAESRFDRALAQSTGVLYFYAVFTGGETAATDDRYREALPGERLVKPVRTRQGTRWPKRRTGCPELKIHMPQQVLQLPSQFGAAHSSLSRRVFTVSEKSVCRQAVLAAHAPRRHWPSPPVLQQSLECVPV